VKINERKALKEKFDVGGMKGTDLRHMDLHKVFVSVATGAIK
jgi:hypothetical protein